jgi:cellulose synthase operon protein C
MRPLLYVGTALLAIVTVGVLSSPFVSEQWSLFAPQQQKHEPLVSVDDLFPRPGFIADATIGELQDEASRVIDQLMARYPESPEALGVLARKYYVLRDWDRAVEVWEQCLEHDPLFAEALFGMGRVALEQQEYEKAAYLLQRARQRVPENPMGPLYVAEALLKSGKAEEAMIILEDHLRSPYATVEALSSLGQVYLQLEQYEKAQENFEAALQFKPDLKPALYGLVRVHAFEGNHERAEHYMKRFQAVSETDRELHVQSLRTLVDRETALQIVAARHHDVAQVYESFGDVKKAEQMWRKAAALNPEHLESRTRLLALYDRNSRYHEALAVGRELVERDPNNVDYWLDVGVLNSRLNRPEEAIAAVQQAIKLEPDNPRCRDAYERIQQLR